MDFLRNPPQLPVPMVMLTAVALMSVGVAATRDLPASSRPKSGLALSHRLTSTPDLQSWEAKLPEFQVTSGRGRNPNKASQSTASNQDNEEEFFDRGSTHNMEAEEQFQHQEGQIEPEGSNSSLPLQRYPGFVASLAGQISKSVIYGGATVTQWNSRIVCPLFGNSGSRDNQKPTNNDQPTLYVFSSRLERNLAFRIYADDEISEQLLDESGIRSDQMTYIFIHGWLGGIHNERWLTEAKDAVLNAFRGSERTYASPSNSLNSSSSSSSSTGSSSITSGFHPNIIIVDWSELAMGNMFATTRNSLLVARRLGSLLQAMVEQADLKPELIHCLGHSVGAHICGQAARQAFYNPAKLNYRVGRITGLDPSGFCYELGVNNETSYLGLRPSDGQIVDAYYSNRSPFGNRYQVARFNVHLNNAQSQESCDVWRHRERARDYFRAAIRFIFGHQGRPDALACDHYFATQFASRSFRQLQQQQQQQHDRQPTGECSLMAYACDSYRNFLRGKCGRCRSLDQCYPIEAEFQRQRPSTGHALQLLGHASQSDPSERYWLSDPQQELPPGGLPYGQRQTYYLRTKAESPFCAQTFRVRVQLDPDMVDASGFRSRWIKLRLVGPNKRMIRSIDPRTGRPIDVVSLFGPWNRLSGHEQQLFGIDNRTLTSLIEVPASIWADLPPSTSLMSSGDPSILPIRQVLIEDSRQSGAAGSGPKNDNNNAGLRDQPAFSAVESIYLDYLSADSHRVRQRESMVFNRDQQFKRIWPSQNEEQNQRALNRPI